MKRVWGLDMVKFAGTRLVCQVEDWFIFLRPSALGWVWVRTKALDAKYWACLTPKPTWILKISNVDQLKVNSLVLGQACYLIWWTSQALQVNPRSVIFRTDPCLSSRAWAHAFLSPKICWASWLLPAFQSIVLHVALFWLWAPIWFEWNWISTKSLIF